MDFGLSPEQQNVVDLAGRVCAGFDDAYWLARDRDARFPEEFYRAVAEAGLIGVACPRPMAAPGSASPRRR